VEAAKRDGLGPRGSALVCGYTEDIAALEGELAALKEAEASLVFPTGFAANLGVLTALGSADTCFFSDALNHASIIDGCRQAKGQTQIYRHRNMAHLEELLSGSQALRKVIVTDSLFSMEGVSAPLGDLVELKARYGAVLVIDEAHATLVFGDRGGGVAQKQGVAARVDFHVGTLSKACGALGGFVATSETGRRYLLNAARSYIYSTALPAPVVAAARAAIRVATRDNVLREALWARVHQLGVEIDQALQAPIASIILGEERHAVEASRALFELGFQPFDLRRCQQGLLVCGLLCRRSIHKRMSRILWRR
jgi:8-amino-7-oxononanoate synthase